MTTKNIGDIAELNALLDMRERANEVLTPFGENVPYDFVVDRGDEFERIQVKNAPLRDGVIKANFERTRYNSNGTSSEAYTEDEIDAFIIYCPNTDSCYYLSIEEAPKTGAYLRVEDPDVKDSSIRYAEEYEL